MADTNPTPPLNAAGEARLKELSRRGLEAFRRGDGRGAYDALKAAADGGAADLDTHMALAIVARMLGKPERAAAAADRVIADQPRNIEALIIKADALQALDQTRKASTFYMMAVRAAPPAGRLPPHLVKELERAQAACAEAAKQYEDVLRQSVQAVGFSDPKGSSRVGQALDIMFGRKRAYTQQPLKFYFPELPQVQFYDPATFDWTGAVEAMADDIRAEARVAWEGGEGLEPYVPADANTPQLDHAALMGNRDWTAFHLYKEGEAQTGNLARCPATAEALSKAPQPDIPGNSPTALFSVLRPGMHIPPHTGMMNTRLICHLPLIVPDGCVLRVGNQERAWDEGRLLIFDDSIEHEARNAGPDTRIVLLFDIWRPELSEEERLFVSAIYGGVRQFESEAADA